MRRVSRNRALCQPAESRALEQERGLNGDARVKQRLNQPKPVVREPEGEQRRPVQEKSSASFGRKQRAWDRQEHKPVVSANAVGRHAKSEVCAHEQADSRLPRLSALFKKYVR